MVLVLVMAKMSQQRSGERVKTSKGESGSGRTCVDHAGVGAGGAGLSVGEAALSWFSGKMHRPNTMSAEARAADLKFLL